MSVRSTSETGEAANIPTQKAVNLYHELVSGYVQDNMKNPGDRGVFAKQFESISELSDDQIKAIQAYAGTKKQFTGLEISKDKIHPNAIKRELASFYVKVNNTKNDIRRNILQEYDINPEEYSKKIQGKIDTIDDIQKLQDILDEERDRKIFLEYVYGVNKIPVKRLAINSILGNDFQDRIKNLSSEDASHMALLTQKMRRLEKIDRADVIFLFESNLLKEEEKQRLIEWFMPTITLQEALELKIIDTKSVRSTKKAALEQSIQSGLFTGIDIDGYINSIDNNDITISTQGLFTHKKTLGTLLAGSVFYTTFERKYHTMIDTLRRKVSEGSIQTRDEFISHLSLQDQVSGVDHFGEGSFVKIEQKTVNPQSKQEEVVSIYGEIGKISSQGTFQIIERGVNGYSRKQSSTSTYTYSEFLDYVGGGKNTKERPKKVEFFSEHDLQARLLSGQIKDLNGELRFQNKESIQSEIKTVSKKIEELESTIEKSKRGENAELQSLYRVRDEKNKRLDAVEEQNKLTLVQKIDELDREGKEHGFTLGTTLQKGSGGEEEFYTVTHIDEIGQKVSILGLKGVEHLDYEHFIYSFEQAKIKRVGSSIMNGEDILKSSKDSPLWGKLLYKNGHFLNESDKDPSNSVKQYKHDLLISKDGQDGIKLHEIEGDRVTISFCKVENVKTKKGGKESTSIKAKIEKNQYDIHVGMLKQYIDNWKLEAKSENEEKIKREEMGNIPKAETEFGFGNWFFQGMSLAAAVQGLKTGVDQIKEMLQEGDKNKSDQFALSVFGPLLGTEGRGEFQARIEAGEKKAMDEFIEKLSGLDSVIATDLIDRWLKDPRCPEYKKEAGMMYMYKKYGALCAKNLYKYQGQFFWYQRMGGIIGDEVWVDTHAENEKDGTNTTEEQLVYHLMKKQCKGAGFNGIKRRSKLHKEVKAMRGQGKSEEIEVGKKDGSAERTVEARIRGGLSELDSGNYPNSIGWLETVVNKGGSMEQMNMMPFVMMFSGMAYKFENDMLDILKNFPCDGNGRLLFMLRFISFQKDIDLMNDTILEVSRRLAARDPNFKGMGDAAEKIYNNAKNPNIKDPDKQKATIDFYQTKAGDGKTYGDHLTKILYMLHTGDKSDIHNKMIFLEKDESETFSRYYDKTKGYFGNVEGGGDVDYSVEGLMDDAFSNSGTSGMSVYRATTDLLEVRQGSWLKKKAGPKMWGEIRNEIKAAATRNYYPNDPIKTQQAREKIVKDILRQFISAIMSRYQNQREVSGYNNPSGPFNQLNTWGIYFEDLMKAGVSSDSLKSGQDPSGESILERFTQQVMNVENGVSQDYEKETIWGADGNYSTVEKGEQPGVLKIEDMVRGKTHEVMQPPANSNTQPYDDELAA